MGERTSYITIDQHHVCIEYHCTILFYFLLALLPDHVHTLGHTSMDKARVRYDYGTILTPAS
jgi:hypothetical protein